MAYNPGITNRSGEILAQGIASAAQTRMQGYQNLTNSVLKGFTDLTKEQQEEEVKRNDTRARLSADPTIRTAIQNSKDQKLIDALAKLDETPKTGFWSKLAPQGDRKNSEFLGKYVTETYEQQGRRDRAELLDIAKADAAYKKTAAQIAAREDVYLQDFRAGLNKPYEAGVKNLAEYNTFRAAQEKREGDLRNEQVALGNQFISGARNDLGGDSLVSGIGGKAYAPPPVKQFDTLPKYPQLGNMGMPSPKREPASQIMMPRSVPRLNLPEALPQAAPEYDTPEKINELIYNFTPGSNSAQQRIRGYGNTITPEIMQRENITQASMDSSAASRALRDATAINNRIRRDAADARNKLTLDLAIEANSRAARGEARTIASEARPTLQDLIARDLGAGKQQETAAMNQEISNNPRAVQFLNALAERFGKVPEEHMAAVEEILNDPTLTKSARSFLRRQIRK